MFQKIISVLMSIIAFFSSLVGLGESKNPPNTYLNDKYGIYKRQVYDLYLPEDPVDGRCGLVLCIHGGSWVAGDKSAYDENTLKSITNTYGVACARINYRYLSSRVNMADIIDDINSALQKIKQRGAENGLNIDKVMLTGGSAGAHLALLYAYFMKNDAPIKPACVVSYCGPTDLTDAGFYCDNDLGDNIYTLMSWACSAKINQDNVMSNIDNLKAVSPVTYVTSECVPTVIAHGCVDTIVPYSNAATLDAKLTECGVEHTLISYPNSGHGLNNDPVCSEATNDLFCQYIENFIR